MPLVSGWSVIILSVLVLDTAAQGQECAPDGTPDFDLDPCALFTPCVDGYVVPYDQNCAKYQMCADGVWRIKDCPTSMQFSTETYICCTDTPSSQCFPPCPSQGPQTIAPYELCEGTPAGCDEGDRAPDKNYCDRYFECVFGIWTSMPCSPGTAFDPVTLECIEDIEEANCAYRCLTTTTAPPTTTTIRPTTTLYTTTQADTTPVMLTTSADGLSYPDSNTTDLMLTNDPNTTDWLLTEEPYTDIVVSDMTGVQSTEGPKPTTPTSATTTTGQSELGTTGETGTTAPEGFEHAILVGSVCGAAAALTIVIVAILAQNGIIKCGKKAPETQVPVTKAANGTTANGSTPHAPAAYVQHAQRPRKPQGHVVITRNVSINV